jgi:hypothetical protein
MLQNLPRNLNFSELEKKILATIAKDAKAISGYNDVIAYGNSIHEVYEHKLTGYSPKLVWHSSINYSTSERLASKVGQLICNLWNDESQWQYWFNRLKEPKKKDFFRGKSSTHMFPWYHRNRRY